MVTLTDVMETIRPHINRVLLYAESSLPEAQFKAFRKLVLDELGNSGLNKDLERLFDERAPQDRQGSGRNTQARKEV